jgi:lipoyl synthase
MNTQRKPPWINIRLTSNETTSRVLAILKEGNLNTVCSHALCPNRNECYSRGTATFLIMGPNCTRNCNFCNVKQDQPLPLDPEEPQKVGEAVLKLNLRYAVITSTTRDDLSDGGAQHFVETIQAIRASKPECYIEVLIPDFQGDEQALNKVLASQPDVLNHNIETVPRLYPTVRPMANYQQSLTLLRRSSEFGLPTKSGIMLGLGETNQEVIRTFQDLRSVGVELLTVGQYLQPSKRHLPVNRYVTPDEFKVYEQLAFDMGYKFVASGPLVRSSYMAERFIDIDKTNRT